jgi:N-carbamoylputrescine amidase
VKLPEVTACAVQFISRVGEPEHNLKRVRELVQEASSRGAKLVVFPELATSGYVLRDRRELAACSFELSSRESEEVATEARRCGAVVVLGFSERSGDRFYNSALIAQPDGSLSVYRKAHLWDFEKELFTPGDTGFPVFETPFSTLAVAICYDLSFPEVFRIYMKKSVEVVAFSTAWVPDPPPWPSHDSLGNSMMNYLVRSRASENSLFVVASSKPGVERGVAFVGASEVVGTRGWPLAGPASRDREELVFATFDPARSIADRKLTERNYIPSDIRDDLYQLSERSTS